MPTDEEFMARTCPRCGCTSDEIRDGKPCPRCGALKSHRPNPIVPLEKR